MIAIVFGKPNRTINVIGYGVDSYKDKNGVEIWRVYGIVTAGGRGRLVSRDSTVVKDIYMDETTVVIFRSSLKEDAEKCKEAYKNGVIDTKVLSDFLVDPNARKGKELKPD